jgi:hypothetical protein
MNKQQKIVASIVAAVLLLTFPIKYFIISHSSTKTMKAILQYWKEKDFYNAIEQWEDREKSPPVDGLNSYTINKKKFFKKNGKHHAQFFVTLDFPAGNPFFVPGREWIFELNYTAVGWKVISFADANPIEPLFPQDVEPKL